MNSHVKMYCLSVVNGFCLFYEWFKEFRNSKKNYLIPSVGLYNEYFISLQYCLGKIFLIVTGLIKFQGLKNKPFHTNVEFIPFAWWRYLWHGHCLTITLIYTMNYVILRKQKLMRIEASHRALETWKRRYNSLT